MCVVCFACCVMCYVCFVVGVVSLVCVVVVVFVCVVCVVWRARFVALLSFCVVLFVRLCSCACCCLGLSVDVFSVLLLFPFVLLRCAAWCCVLLCCVCVDALRCVVFGRDVIWFAVCVVGFCVLCLFCSSFCLCVFVHVLGCDCVCVGVCDCLRVGWCLVR